jgi:hypothetical protein
LRLPPNTFDLSEINDFSDQDLLAMAAPVQTLEDDFVTPEPNDPAPIQESSHAPDTDLDEGSILTTIRRAYDSDPVGTDIIQAKKRGDRRVPYKLIHGSCKLRIELGDCALNDGILYVQHKIYIPDTDNLRARIIEHVHHASCGGGHSGRHGSYEKLNRWYYWPRMVHDVAQYVQSCLTCRRTKSYRDGKHGLLHPLPIPERYWSSISIDYITHLPLCTDNGRTYMGILVVVDRLSKKKKKFIPVVHLKVNTLVRAFVEYVWREEGFPDDIVSDRGAQFTSHWWTRLCQRLGTRPRLSTSFHPETDRQTENANAWLQQYLRAYVNYEQDN